MEQVICTWITKNHPLSCRARKWIIK